MRHAKKAAFLGVFLIVMVLGVVGDPAAAQARPIEIISVSVDAGGANDESWDPSINADGRYVAFLSFADNLVQDHPGEYGIYVRDRRLRTTSLVGTGSEQGPSISGDGRYIAFSSYAANLVPGDTNSASDIFVYDRATDSTTRASVASDGTQAYGGSYSPRLSADGRYVVYISDAANLVPGDTNGATDVFIHDRVNRTTTRVSVATDGTQANGFSLVASISGDGRHVAFSSDATNLVSRDSNGKTDIFVRDLLKGTTVRASVADDGKQGGQRSESPFMSFDGRYVAFGSWSTNLVPGDTNGAEDVFVRDMRRGTTERVSVSSTGAQAGGDLGGASDPSSMTADGRFVAFSSYASNLVPGDTNQVPDAFVHDCWFGTTARVSLAADGTEGNGGSGDPALSADGSSVAFWSWADNLVPGDKNRNPDVFCAALSRLLPVPPFLWLVR